MSPAIRAKLENLRAQKRAPRTGALAPDPYDNQIASLWSSLQAVRQQAEQYRRGGQPGMADALDRQGEQLAVALQTLQDEQWRPSFVAARQTVTSIANEPQVLAAVEALTTLLMSVSRGPAYYPTYAQQNQRRAQYADALESFARALPPGYPNTAAALQQALTSLRYVYTPPPASPPIRPVGP